MSYRALDRLRRAVQVAALLFLFAIPLLLALEVYWLLGSFYALSVGGLEIADPLMALQNLLLSHELHLPLLLAAALPAALALVLGRVFCSWACPYNTFAEWVAAAEKRIAPKRRRRRRLVPPAANPRPGVYWGIFAALLLVTLVLGFPLLASLSLPGVISTQISQSLLGMGLGLEVALVAVVLLAEVAVGRRFWCKYACPVGACLSLFHGRRTLALRHDPALCHCKGTTEPCHMACPLGLAPKRPGLHPYCFNCGVCAAVCEKTGSTSLRLTRCVPRATPWRTRRTPQPGDPRRP